MDALVTLFLLAAAGAVFSAMFPAGFTASRQAHQSKIATAIASRKMEQLRAMDYESLTQPILQANDIIDPGDTASPYSFTSVDSVAASLTSGAGELTIEDVSSDIKRVKVTVTWEGATSSEDRSVRLTSLIADKRTRRLN